MDFRVCLRAASAFLTAACVAACLSSKAADIQGFDKATLFGMVYDERNEPCAGARIEVDDRAGPTTDLAGRFAIVELARGSHGIVVVKAGYEKLESEIDFFDKSQVLYLKVASLANLLVRLEAALAERRFADAKGLVARAEAVAPAAADVRYLRAVLRLKSGDPTGATVILEQMIGEGERAPALYATLADIYEHALADRAKARAALAAYLRLQEDAGARARLEALSREP